MNLKSLLLAGTVLFLLSNIPQSNITSAISPTQNHFIPNSYTYQFSSWAGGGVQLSGNSGLLNGATIEQEFQNSASLGMLWVGYGQTNWCQSANDSVSTISPTASGPESLYSPAFQKLIVNYQIPFMVQVPLDGYGRCSGWASKVREAFPQLTTIDSVGAQITEDVSACGDKPNCGQGSYIRLDSLQFSKQIFDDLVNIKNNMAVVNSGALAQWDGIYVSSIGADWGGYPSKVTGHFPNFMLDPASISDFAGSGLCVTQCSELLSLATSATFDIPSIYSVLSAACNIPNPPVSGSCPAGSLGAQFELYTNTEYYLGLSYAAYNFSMDYLGGRPFVVAPSYSLWLTPAQYPAPYNTNHLRELNLLQKEMIGAGAYVENGNAPKDSTVASDLGICRSNAPYGNSGGFLAATGGTAGNPFYVTYIRNMIYYEAACAGASFMEPGNFAYAPSGSGWSQMVAFGTLLNRMKNIESNFSYTTPIVAGDPSTGVTVLSGQGVGLAWFYTNGTRGDTASISVSADSLGVTPPWVAISALDWTVVGDGNSDVIPIAVSIPPRGWNPVYIFEVGALPGVLYSNVHTNFKAGSGPSDTVELNGPADLGSWIVVKTRAVPTGVISNGASVLPCQTATMLNSTNIGYDASLVHSSEAGWYYDQATNLLFAHIPLNNTRSDVTILYGDPQNDSTQHLWCDFSGPSSTTASHTSPPTSSSAPQDSGLLWPLVGILIFTAFTSIAVAWPVVRRIIGRIGSG